jgi:hypothetical protein
VIGGAGAIGVPGGGEADGESGAAAADEDNDDGGTVGTFGAADDCGDAPVPLFDVPPAAEPPPLDAPTPTGDGTGALSAAPQSSQYSAPAGFSFWQTWQIVMIRSP